MGNQNDVTRKRIHVFGPCIIGGCFVKDIDTIPSQLQYKINCENDNYDVINYGTCGFYRSYK